MYDQVNMDNLLTEKESFFFFFLEALKKINCNQALIIFDSIVQKP